MASWFTVAGFAIGVVVFVGAVFYHWAAALREANEWRAQREAVKN